MNPVYTIKTKQGEVFIANGLGFGQDTLCFAGTPLISFGNVMINSNDVESVVFGVPEQKAKAVKVKENK